MLLYIFKNPNIHPTNKTMERSGNLNSILISLSFHLFIFFSLFFISTFTTTNSAPLIPDPLQGLLCGLKNICGRGKCVASNASVIGFDCVCDVGWKTIQIGVFTFPSCLVPNCTLDLQCGKGSPPSPPPPPPSLPSINISDPCGLVWCGEGTCKPIETGHACQCDEGSDNLFGLTDLACFKDCAFGADCNGLGLGGSAALPPPTPKSDSNRKGSNDVPNCSRNLRAMTMILLSATFLTWI